jgi:hypothetical protein
MLRTLIPAISAASIHVSFFAIAFNGEKEVAQAVPRV